MTVSDLVEFLANEKAPVQGGRTTGCGISIICYSTTLLFAVRLFCGIVARSCQDLVYDYGVIALFNHICIYKTNNYDETNDTMQLSLKFSEVATSEGIKLLILKSTICFVELVRTMALIAYCKGKGIVWKLNIKPDM